MENFLDSSKFSLQAVLLLSGYIHLSIPIAHSVHVKKLQVLKVWLEICGDLTVIGLLLEI